MQCRCAMRAAMSRWFFLEKNFPSRALLQDFGHVGTKWNHTGRHIWYIGMKKSRISRRLERQVSRPSRQSRERHGDAFQ